MLILKVVKVPCFHTLLQVLILKGLRVGAFGSGSINKNAAAWFAKVAAGFLDVPLNEIYYTQLVITCQSRIASGSVNIFV